MDVGGLHPAKLMPGMLRLRSRRATVHGRTAVLGIRSEATVTRSRRIAARSAPATCSVAVNGYTDAADRWLQAAPRPRCAAGSLRPSPSRRT
jgi:hypothetical protein